MTSRHLGQSLTSVLVASLLLALLALAAGTFLKDIFRSSRHMEQTYAFDSAVTEIALHLADPRACRLEFKNADDTPATFSSQPDVLTGPDAGLRHAVIGKIVDRAGNRIVAIGQSLAENMSVTSIDIMGTQPALTKVLGPGKTGHLVQLRVKAKGLVAGRESSRTFTRLIQLTVTANGLMDPCLKDVLTIETVVAKRTAYSLNGDFPCSQTSGFPASAFRTATTTNFSYQAWCDLYGGAAAPNGLSPFGVSPNDPLCSRSTNPLLPPGESAVVAFDHFFPTRLTREQWTALGRLQTSSRPAPDAAALIPPATIVPGEGRCPVHISETVLPIDANIPTARVAANRIFKVKMNDSPERLALGCNFSEGWVVSSCSQANQGSGLVPDLQVHRDSSADPATKGDTWCSLGGLKAAPGATSWGISSVVLFTSCSRVLP